MIETGTGGWKAARTGRLENLPYSRARSGDAGVFQQEIEIVFRLAGLAGAERIGGAGINPPGESSAVGGEPGGDRDA
jgi:hypothetical protein